MIPRETRHPTHASIIVSARGFGRHFVVTNVSKTGAAIQGKKELRVGEKVTLNVKNRRVSGVVRWSENCQAGIAFERRLDESSMDILLTPPPPSPRPEMRAH